MWGEGVDPWTSWIAEAEEFGNLVVGFAGGVVDGASHVAISPDVVAFRLRCETLPPCQIQMRVATGDDKRKQRELHRGFAAFARLHQNGVDVAFEMVDGDERLVEAEGEGFGVGDANEQCASEAWACGDSDGIEVGEGDWMSRRSAGAGHCFADDRDNVAEMFAGGKFGNHAAVVCVEGHLRGDDV